MHRITIAGQRPSANIYFGDETGKKSRKKALHKNAEHFLAAANMGLALSPGHGAKHAAHKVIYRQSAGCSAVHLVERRSISGEGMTGDIGMHKSRADQGYIHLLIVQLCPKRIEKAMQGMFGGRISAAVRSTIYTGNAAHYHDMPAALFQHLRQQRFGKAHRPEKINIKQAAVYIQRRFQYQGALTHTAVMYNDIDPPHGVYSLLHFFIKGGGIRQVKRKYDMIGTPQFSPHPFQFLAVTGGKNQPGAGPVQLAAKLFADTGRRPGNPYSLLCKRFSHIRESIKIQLNPVRRGPDHPVKNFTFGLRMNRRKWSILLLASIPLLSLALHWRIFSLDLMGQHVWRQTQTQTVIRNFYREDMNILNPRINGDAQTNRIRRMEFPLMQWLYANVFKLFGEHIFISRLLTFIMGLFTVFGFYRLCLRLWKDPLLAAIGAWAFNFSPVFYYYTLNPLPDNMALCLGIWSTATYLQYRSTRKTGHLLLSCFLAAVMILVKLPFVLFLAFPGMNELVQGIRKGQRMTVTLRNIALLFFCLVPSICWYAWVIPQWGNNPVIAGMAGNKLSLEKLLFILLVHTGSTLPEVLVNYASMPFFGIGMLLLLRRSTWRHPLLLPLAAWGMSTIAYLLFELNAINVYHDYYLFPFLPLLFILVVQGIRFLLQQKQKAIRYLAAGLVAVLPLTAFLRMDSRWNPQKPEFNVDFYTYRDELKNLVPQDALCVVGNDVSTYILLYYIDKKGWAFDMDQLSPGPLDFWIRHGAEYLYTDTYRVNDPAVQPYLKEKLFDKGTVKVFRIGPP